jgi:hypothetical protein
MEILRVSSSPDLIIDSLSSTTTYLLSYQDLADNSITTANVTSNSEGIVQYEVPKLVDAEYKVWLDLDGETIWEDDISVVRPYSDPYINGTTASEISNYAKNERLARAIIDSIVLDGFYYKNKVIELTGNGSDYLPLWDDVKVIKQVYVNNVLSYDKDLDYNETIYKLSPDKTAMIMYWGEEFNRNQSDPKYIPMAMGDIVGEGYSGTTFPKGYDYTIIAEVGYKNIPSDLTDAVELLIHDIECGKLDYYKRYVTAYNTDQFRIQFDKAMFEGTGNILVDKILSKYNKSITKIGVL